MYKIDYGFGVALAEPFTVNSYKIIESEDPCLPVGTIIPVEDLTKAGAVKVG